jgi:hypothetical protein
MRTFRLRPAAQFALLIFAVVVVATQAHRAFANDAAAMRGTTVADVDNTPSPSPSPSATATPNPWREIKVGTQSLDQPPVTGGIQVLSAFAAVRKDGRGAIACLSFKNTAPVAAKHLLVDFPFFDQSGANVGTLHLNRVGTFSSGIEIMSYQDFSAWSGGGGPRGYTDNCTRLDLAVAAMPILAARFASYRVTRIDFADGTTWPKQPQAASTP